MGTAAAEGGPTPSGSPTVRGIINPVMTDIEDQNSHSNIHCPVVTSWHFVHQDSVFSGGLGEEKTSSQV